MLRVGMRKCSSSNWPKSFASFEPGMAARSTLGFLVCRRLKEHHDGKKSWQQFRRYYDEKLVENARYCLAIKEYDYDWEVRKGLEIKAKLR